MYTHKCMYMHTHMHEHIQMCSHIHTHTEETSKWVWKLFIWGKWAWWLLLGDRRVVLSPPMWQDVKLRSWASTFLLSLAARAQGRRAPLRRKHGSMPGLFVRMEGRHQCPAVAAAWNLNYSQQTCLTGKGRLHKMQFCYWKNKLENPRRCLQNKCMRGLFFFSLWSGAFRLRHSHHPLELSLWT